MVTFIYLHGLYSSSQSRKALFLKKNIHHQLKYKYFFIPDFYPQKWEFEKEMTVSYLLKKLNEWVYWGDEDVFLIGSSFGGLISSRFIQLSNNFRVKGQILLAPALDFYKIILDTNSESEIEKWKENGFKYVNHPFWGKTKWNYKFFKDLKSNHNPMDEKFKVSTLIFHGSNDATIPYPYILDFVERQDNQKITFDLIQGGDHQLIEHLRYIEKKISDFVLTVI